MSPNLVVAESVVTKDIKELPQEIYDTTVSLNGGTAEDAAVISEGTDKTVGITIDAVSESDRSIVFTNTRKTQTVTVSNTVSGYSGNIEPFKYKVTVTDVIEGGVENPRDYDANGFTDGVYQETVTLEDGTKETRDYFELTSGQSKELTVPYGAKLKVEQVFVVGYETTNTVTPSESGSESSPNRVSFTISEDKTIAFSNSQLINLVLENKTPVDLEGVKVKVNKSNIMYRVIFNDDGEPISQEQVSFNNKTADIDLGHGQTAILEVQYDASQTYEVSGNTSVDGYYYSIQNESSYHEDANPANMHFFNADDFSVSGNLKYGPKDSTVIFTTQPLVSYDVNGGSWTTEMEDYHDRDGDRQVYQYAVNKGDKAPKPETDPVYPTAEGIAFLGWTDDENIKNTDHSQDDENFEGHYIFDAETNKVEAPLTLYAVWKMAPRNDRIVTVKNNTGAPMSFSPTIGGTAGEGFTLEDGGTRNLQVQNGTNLVIQVPSAAIAVSSEFALVSTDNNTKHSITSVNRDGTVTFAAGVCKITDKAGTILYDGQGKPAVYDTLSAAFAAYSGTLYTDEEHTTVAAGDNVQAYVKMLVDEYAITAKHNFPTKDVILTTAGKNEDFPYAGMLTRSTLYRDDAFNNAACFSLAASETKVELTNIILDGRETKVAKTIKGGLIFVSYKGAELKVTAGAILRNVVFADYSDANYGRGGAIYIDKGSLTVEAGLFENLHARRGGAICAEGSAALNISGTDESTRFENCYAETSGGAVYYEVPSPLTVNGGDDNGFKVDAAGNTLFNDEKKKIEADNPGIVFYSCTAKSSAEGNGGAIYIKSIGAADIRGCSFVECSAKVNKGDNRENGGGAITARDVEKMTVSNCTFSSCDSMTTGGAIFAKIKNGSTGMEVNNSIFRNASSKGQGGAVGVYQVTETYKSSSALTINGCRFENCSRVKSMSLDSQALPIGSTLIGRQLVIFMLDSSSYS